ncbi:MAG: ABC transporter permease [Alphaproteobacteria bacterium]|nr:ABC transporter permease [Alphaproteobacteria bacterium]
MKSTPAQRIGALVLRHYYLFRGSWPRILEMAYWPTVNMLVWGLVSQFLAESSNWVARSGGVFIAAVLLWDVLFRGNLGVALAFLEEMWSRNLGQLFVSPLRPIELVAAMLVMSLLRTTVGILPAALLAIPFFDFSIFKLGWPLLAFYANLLFFGGVMGLGVSSLVLRFGLGAESLAWVLIFALAPISCVYYPISVLPDWIQPLAWALPPTHVFEGLRAAMMDGRFDTSHFLAALGLNVLYAAGATILFLSVFQVARKKGLLLNVGE